MVDLLELFPCLESLDIRIKKTVVPFVEGATTGQHVPKGSRIVQIVYERLKPLGSKLPDIGFHTFNWLYPEIKSNTRKMKDVIRSALVQLRFYGHCYDQPCEYYTMQKDSKDLNHQVGANLKRMVTEKLQNVWHPH